MEYKSGFVFGEIPAQNSKGRLTREALMAYPSSTSGMAFGSK